MRVHELAIAQSILTIAERHAAGRRISRVEVEVGHLRQVVPAALRFSFELVAEGTAAEGAELELTEVPAGGVCRRCGADGDLGAFPLACQACGGLDVEVTRGEELTVEAIEVTDDALVTNGG